MTDRPMLVLLPGLLCDDRLWKPQVEALSNVADVVIADLTLDETMSDMAARAGRRAGQFRAGRAFDGWLRRV